jgi:sugar phosphate isomerase/epimerase
VVKRQFGVSTHLYHDQRLRREHLLEIAAHGFEAVEICATRTHVDYHNPAAVAELQQWLAESGLEVFSVHAPVGAGYAGGRWSGPLSIASADAEARRRAMAEAEQALYIARRIPVKVFVVHAGSGMPPRAGEPGPADSRDGARRSIETLADLAAPLGVRIAVETGDGGRPAAGRPASAGFSRLSSLVHFIEADVDADVGICLDFGHAHLEGDLVDTIEVVSEHVMVAHVHDNQGRVDDHLVPLDGTIDWPAALTAVQKIGYDDALMLEIVRRGSARDTLVRARTARRKMEGLL